MAFVKLNQYDSGTDQIGAFSGYIRRPQPNISGMVAQFFGENGDDADTISALSLTKYQDAQVFVSVYVIKDALGKVMKSNDGNYPLIASFIGVIRRPTPNKNGMIAQFFAPNGEDADSVNDLGKSIYQDSLVFVDVRGKLAKFQQEKNKQIFIPSVESAINEQYLNKVTQQQIKEYSKKENHFKKMNDILELSGFLRNTDVLYNLGNEEEYRIWLMDKGCSFPSADKCLNKPISLLQIKGLINAFNYIPFCTEHAKIISENYDILPTGIKYLEIKQMVLIQEWAKEKLRLKFSLTGIEEPDPEKIIEWTHKHGLNKILPHKYKP